MTHIPYSKLEEKIEKAEEHIKIGGTYYHWKDPDTHYKVESIGLLEWDEETVIVIYQPVGHPTIKWIRRLEGEDGWLTPVTESPHNNQRFILINKP